MPAEFYRNSGLFSDYYLRELLPREPEWHADLSDLFQKIKTLYLARKDELPHLKESSLEERFIRPVLTLLGHSFEPGPSLPPGTEGFKRPDYALFSDEATRKAALPHQGKDKFFQLCTGLGEVKPWGRALDKKLTSEKGTFEAYSPTWQMSQYLWRSGVKWGILTDGRFWRIYERETSKRLDIYYEIDLTAIVESGDLDGFKYFGLFLRKEAFPAFLDKVYLESVEYAREVGEDLKGNIYKALKTLCEGFVKNPANKLTPNDIEFIRANAFIFLYRLLFIFYAEARELVPLDNPIYQDTYSLKALRDEIKHKLDDPIERNKISPFVHTYWERLRTLFDLVNRGSEVFGIPKDALYVPPYNGGLFDSESHRELESWRVGDTYLAEVIDLLARSPAKKGEGKAFVYYKDLDIRHLGSIYEGLLEYKLKIAEEEMVPLKEKSKEVYTTLRDAKKEKKKFKEQDVIPAGQLYLATDKGERKATGSYYTPDYIVKYIVENTLGPLIEEKKRLAQELAENKRPELAALKKSIAGLKAQRARKPEIGKLYEEKIAQEEKKLAELKKEIDPQSILIDEILNLKVLDPAMGSGHFLVEATDFLAQALVEALGGSPKQVEEEDKRWARREVVEKCIYGVDLNPLAVELAKLSLWLSTVARNKPLNFLDHHLRCGNSLIGAKIKELARLPHPKKKKVAEGAAEQLGLFEQVFKERVNLLLNAFAQIEARPSESVDDVKWKEERYKEFRKHVARFQDVADLWTSAYFGNPINQSDYEAPHQRLRDPDAEWEKLKGKDWFQKAIKTAKDKCFFHWELEFPEVFYEGAQEKENPGFHAVVGNPPYGSTIPSEDRNLIIDRFESARRLIDNYLLFIERGLHLCQQNRRLGFIIPSGWLTAVDYSVFRKIVLNVAAPEVIVHLPYDVFPSAYIDTIVVVLLKCSGGLRGSNANYKTKVKRYGIRDSALNLPTDEGGYQFISSHKWLHDDLVRINTKLASPFSAVIVKITQIGVPLGEFVKVDRGITPFKKVPKTHPSAAPGFQGELDRYFVSPDPGVWVQFDESLKEYLPPEFTRGERLIVRRIISRQFRLIAALYNNELVFNKSYLICLAAQSFYRLGFLASIVNSRLMSRWFTELTEIAYRDDFPQIDIYTLKQIPVRRINFTTPDKERERLLQEGKRLYEQCLSKDDQACVVNFVEHCLKQEPEQSDVVQDLLGFLAQQMNEMNKDKQGETKRFFSWLKDVHGIDRTALKPKTYLDKSWEVSTSDFFAYLARNKVKPGPGAYSQIRDSFENSSAKLQALMRDIQATDCLIDQIVYKLYGLTEEEVKIVEGGTRGSKAT